jgi:hypothetical protein
MNFIEHLRSRRVAGFFAFANTVASALAPDSAYQAYLKSALEIYGIEADEIERAVITGIWELYEPGMNLLAEADLSAVEPERAPDLSRPPAR